MLIAAIALAASARLTPADPLVIHVSPAGRAEWSGRASQPTADGVDGPLASLAQAIAHARRREPGRQAIIEVAGGRYALETTIVLTPEDSGFEASPLIVRAREGDAVILDGGAAISAWTDDGQGRWHADLPASIRAPRSAWVGTSRRSRARHPNDGELEIIDPAPGGFVFSPSKLWTGIAPAELHVRDGRRRASLLLAGVDEARGRAEVVGAWEFAPSQRFVVTGPGALDAPGEWIEHEGRASYIPRDGERVDGFGLVMPRLDSMIRFEGAEGEPVRNITIQGIDFEHWGAGAAIEARHAERIRLERCRVEHGAGVGLDFAEGARDCAWSGGRIADTGHEAAAIGGESCVIEGAIIREASSLDPTRPAIRVAGSRAAVWRNDIADTPTTGILVEGRDDTTSNAEVSRNRVHHIGGGASPIGIDAAPGARVHSNMVWEIGSLDVPAEGVGVWARAGVAESAIENNIITRCAASSIAVDAGAAAVVTNNILAYSHGEQLWLVGDVPSPRLRVLLNVIVFNNGRLLGPGRSAWVGHGLGPGVMDSNLYADISRRELWFGCPNLAGWRALGHDANCLVAAPMLLDPAAPDLRLHRDSPAFLLGIAPINPDAIGPALAAESAPLTDRVGMPSMIAEPRVIDFEDDTARTRPDRLLVAEAPEIGATARIADGGVGGRACLRLHDAEGTSPNWLPSAGLNPRLPPGDYRVEFDLRVANAPDAVSGYIVEHQWRDAWPGEYRAGPAFAVDSRGWMWSQGRKIVVLRPDHWWHIAIECQVGEQATGRHVIIVTGEDGQTRKFLLEGKVICALEWVGFVAPASASTVTEIDNLTITLREPTPGAR